MPDPETLSDRMIREVSEKQNRMLRARIADTGFWSSLQVLGTVGWSVTLPTLLGIGARRIHGPALAGALFVDTHAAVRWAVLGCANAWLHLRGNNLRGNNTRGNQK